MKLIRGVAVTSIVVASSACSNGGDTLVVHVAYKAEPQLINNALSANFNFCRVDEDNEITVIVDDIPPGETIVHEYDPNGPPPPATTTWKCSKMLED